MTIPQSNAPLQPRTAALRTRCLLRTPIFWPSSKAANNARPRSLFSSSIMPKGTLMTIRSAEEAIATDFQSYCRKVFSTCHDGQPLGDQRYLLYLMDRLSQLASGAITRLIVNLPPGHL